MLRLSPAKSGNSRHAQRSAIQPHAHRIRDRHGRSGLARLCPFYVVVLHLASAAFPLSASPHFRLGASRFSLCATPFLQQGFGIIPASAASRLLLSRFVPNNAWASSRMQPLALGEGAPAFGCPWKMGQKTKNPIMCLYAK